MNDWKPITNPMGRAWLSPDEKAIIIEMAPVYSLCIIGKKKPRGPYDSLDDAKSAYDDE